MDSVNDLDFFLILIAPGIKKSNPKVALDN